MTKRRQFCPRGHDTFQIGRDASKKCLQCKAEAAAAKAALQEQARAESRARFERTQAEADRRREQEYQQAIKGGGDVAAEARWQRLCDETLEKTGSRFGLCQWQDERQDGYAPRTCTRRTGDVFCHVHNRELDRESERRRREKERAFDVIPHPYDSEEED
jgi:hypothetical protein